MELFNVVTREEAWARLEPYILPVNRAQVIAVEEALGRVAAKDVTSLENVPSFPRSAMDGYAVRAEDTFGSSESLPSCLTVVGEVRMGAQADIEVGPGQAALIHTGGMMAKQADAVVMVENARIVDTETIEVVRAVARGENVLRVGEDVKEGDIVIAAGSVVRPPSIGVMLAAGITRIEVFDRVRVALISTGDELVPPDTRPGPGQIRNTNAYSLAGLAVEAGADPVRMGIVKDQREHLLATCQRAMQEADIVAVTAGSSVSTRDLTADVIQELGSPGVLVHGVSIRPGKPVILACIEGVPFFGLPGNPSSCMITFSLFVTPAIQKRGGYDRLPGWHHLQAKLTRNVPSVSGREDYVTVKLIEKDGEVWAEPLFAKSNFLSAMREANGVARIPLNRGGLSEGEDAFVRLL